MGRNLSRKDITIVNLKMSSGVDVNRIRIAGYQSGAQPEFSLTGAQSKFKTLPRDLGVFIGGGGLVS